MRIAIVEGSEPIAKWLSLVLKPHYAEVESFPEGGAAVAALRQQPADLLLVESLLADTDAEKLLAALREADALRRAIVIFPPVSEMALEHSADAHLVRPFSREALLELVQQVLVGDAPAAGDQAPSAPGAADSAAAAAGAPPAEEMPASLALALAALFRRGATGVLHISNEGLHRRVSIRGGAPTHVTGEYSSDNFGRFLVRRRIIDAETLERSHEIMVSKGLPQGEALVDSGAISSARLFHLLRAFQRERLLSMFSWAEPVIRFEPSAVIPAGEAVYEMDPTALIFEGFQRSAEVEALYAWQEANGERFAVRTARYAELSRALQALNPKLKLADLTTGSTPLSRLLQQTSVDLIFGLRALRALEVLGMIELRDEPAPAAGQEPATDEGHIVGAYPLAQPGVDDLGHDIDVEADAQAAATLEEIFSTYLALQFRDHYGLLGVARAAAQADIDAAYEQQRARFERALRAHLQHPQARAKGQEILLHLQFARSVLSSETSRAAYDVLLEQRETQRLERRISLGAETRFKAGLAALREQRPHVARIEFEAARALRPNDPLCALYASWAAYLELQPTARQIAALRRALDEGSRLLNDAEGYAFQAQICHDLGFFEQARLAVREALNRDPACAPARQLLDLLDSQP